MARYAEVAVEAARALDRGHYTYLVPPEMELVPGAVLLGLDAVAPLKKGRTAARESTRYGLSLVQLRGRAGEVVATDGRCLLVQGGFPLPWPEDVLVPRVAAFGMRLKRYSRRL